MKPDETHRRAGRPDDERHAKRSSDPLDDPRLTAFALGELEDEGDRTAMEALVAESPDARRMVDEIRGLAGDLERELAREPMPEAGPGEAAIAAKPVASSTDGGTDVSTTVVSPRRTFPFGVLRLAAAAMLIVAASFGAWWIVGGSDRVEMRGDASDQARMGLRDLPAEELNREEAEIAVESAKRQAQEDALRRLSRLGYVSGSVPAAGRTPADPSPPRVPATGTEVDLFYGDSIDGDVDAVAGEDKRGYLALQDSLAKGKDISGSADWLLGNKGDKERAGATVLNIQSEQGATTPYLGAELRLIEGAEAIKPQQRTRLRALGYSTEPVVSAKLEALGYITDEAFEYRAPSEGPSTESYDAIEENDFVAVSQDPLSTFSIDVDTASYSNVRRFLRSGQMPPPGAVRLEELINYFSYDYPLPDGSAPFSSSLEVAACPWAPDHRLVRVALQGRRVPREERPPLNLVFLLDVSGSMNSQNKLPLVKESLGMLVDDLRADDRVAIVVYAGASGLVLDSTPGSRRGEIAAALGRLGAGGSTNGGEGLRLAYEVARRHRVDGGANRVILCTDGDFNVGTTNESELVSLVEQNAKTGVYLTVLGFGTGNLKDSLLEAISAKGDGTYGYIDSRHEARKVFVDHASGTLVPIAKDVKIQVEFNPLEVASFRLLGYENRKMAHQDFRDDKKDAGEIGAGHTVTAFYEIVPAGGESPAPEAEALTYQRPGEPSAAAFAGELLTLRVRYKDPDSPAAAEARQNGVFDEPEPFTDINGTGAYDPGEPYIDRNGNGAYDHGDAYTDVNGNGRYDLGEPYQDAAVAPPVAASRELSFPLKDSGQSFAGADDDFKFAAAVTGFGMLLRRSEYAGPLNYDLVEELARDGLGDDRYGYRAELLELVGLAKGQAAAEAKADER